MLENNLNNSSDKNSPDQFKKGAAKVRFLLEEIIENLQAVEQTPETIAEIASYQTKLAEHNAKLDAKYTVVSPTVEEDPFDRAMGADPTDRATRRGF